MKPETLWKLSCRLHLRGLTPLAKIVKLVNFALFHAVLPYEAEIEGRVQLWHRGLGVVIHPNTRIGDGVQIAQHVTVAAGDWEVSRTVRVILGPGAMIGAGAFLSSKRGSVLTIGRGARVGANAVVTRDVPEGATVVGPQATTLSVRVVD